jgi:hypothetical protein
MVLEFAFKTNLPPELNARDDENLRPNVPFHLRLTIPLSYYQLFTM